jgi:signal transduction histidine kinase
MEHSPEAAQEALRLAREEAEAASRAKSAFFAGMIYELRTPLNAVIGFSEMMRTEALGPLGNERYRSYTEHIHSSGMQLAEIINNILDWVKAEAGMIELHEEVFDLRETIRSVHQSISAPIGDHGLSDSVVLPADLPLLRADERRTRQVLLNLVSNAIRFTPPGGKVEIASRFDPEIGVIVTVSDTGIGIAPKDLTRVLEPFKQADSSLSRLHRGSGLGLPLVKAIMELHGGNLDLRSEVGAGTQARVTFPPDRAVLDPNRQSER